MNNIIEKLKNQEIKMRPKWHFILGSVLLILLTVLVLLLTLFLASFLLFYLKTSGFFFGPLPFILLLLMVAFIVLVEFLINRYAVAYRKPVVYSLIIIVIIIFTMGLVMNKANFHERVERRKLPMIKRFYNMSDKKPMRRNIKIEINKGERL